MTSIAGPLTRGRAGPLDNTHAVLATHKGQTYVIWGSQRSRIDPADRSVTFNLGLDPDATYPVEISNALFDALPATEPLVVPGIPEVGSPSRWMPGKLVGSVVETRDATGKVSGFYALLPGGVQKITSFVADLLRTANSLGATAPEVVSPDLLVDIPEVDALNVDYYPPGRLTFIDTSANPVTCVAWDKLSTDRQATVNVLTGKGLPVSPAMDERIINLVRDDRGPDSVIANQALVLPGAANFVATTSGVITSDTRESLFWLSPQGVRYGIESDEPTLRALGLDPRLAVQAPWPIVRTFPPGPAVNKASALLARDVIPVGGSVAAVPTGNPGG